MQAIAEILGPVQNPRYLLVRRLWLGSRRRIDYHAAPAALGTRKKFAKCSGHDHGRVAIPKAAGQIQGVFR